MLTRIKNLIKISFLLILNAIYGFFVFYILPTLLIFAFNLSKGPVNNSDGELFVPVAWILMLLIPVLFFFINKAIIKKFFLSKKVFFISIPAFVIGATFAIIITNANYSTNYISILKELGF